MLYVGVDPGKTGGIAILNEIGRVLLVQTMPAGDAELFEIFTSNKEAASDGITAALEEVWTVGPQMGRVSAFSFGGEYRRVQALLTAARIPFVLVRPQRWQAAIGCQTKGDKRVSLARAKDLFGLQQAIKITHSVADALLIAEWRRRTTDIS